MASEAWVKPSEHPAMEPDPANAYRPAAPAYGETSVPEGPVSSSPRTRILGAGSIAGTLCADPEIRFSQNGKAIVKARVAVSERRQDRGTGHWSNGPAEFMDITVWGGQGERLVEFLRKGDRVVVNGIWQESTWKGKDDEEHTTRTLSVRDIGPSLMFRGARVLRNQEGS